MPTKDIFARNFNARFARAGNGPAAPDWMIAWAYEAFRMGYQKGQDDFMREHDWHE